nr:hypothetical protein [Mammaliicoccus sp. Marseille-Q6498]
MFQPFPYGMKFGYGSMEVSGPIKKFIGPEMIGGGPLNKKYGPQK